MRLEPPSSERAVYVADRHVSAVPATLSVPVHRCPLPAEPTSAASRGKKRCVRCRARGEQQVAAHVASRPSHAAPQLHSQPHLPCGHHRQGGGTHTAPVTGPVTRAAVLPPLFRAPQRGRLAPISHTGGTPCRGPVNRTWQLLTPHRPRNCASPQVLIAHRNVSPP